MKMQGQQTNSSSAKNLLSTALFKHKNFIKDKRKTKASVLCKEEQSWYLEPPRTQESSSRPRFEVYHVRYQIIMTSAIKISLGSTIGSAGILLSPRVIGNLFPAEKISDCTIVTELNSKPVTALIACYCPANTNDEKLAYNFYCDLKGGTESVPSQNILVIAGDVNA